MAAALSGRAPATCSSLSSATRLRARGEMALAVRRRRRASTTVRESRARAQLVAGDEGRHGLTEASASGWRHRVGGRIAVPWTIALPARAVDAVDARGALRAAAGAPAAGGSASSARTCRCRRSLYFTCWPPRRCQRHGHLDCATGIRQRRRAKGSITVTGHSPRCSSTSKCRPGRSISASRSTSRARRRDQPPGDRLRPDGRLTPTSRARRTSSG